MGLTSGGGGGGGEGDGCDQLIESNMGEGFLFF